MASDLNKCLFIGRLGQDPEVKYTGNGKAVANISIATSESWNDKKSGEKKKRTEWVRVVFFNRLAEIVGEYLRKGSHVYVEGRLQTRKWQDQNGQDRYTTEIVASDLQMLGGRGDAAGVGGNVGGSQQGFGGQPSSPSPSPQQGGQQQAPPVYGDDFDQDIPF